MVPLGVLADDDDDWEADETTPGQVLTVVGRWDYRITDPDALIDAGRRTYLEYWTDDIPEDAELHVERVETAAGVIMHGDGVNRLDDAPGLEQVRYTTTVLSHDGLPEDDFNDNPFAIAMSRDHNENGD
ncbi:hypothetical protein [Oryzobacter telluris]|uniref:hypothetical protein n=1 Tax=Oryzobacter telluris TaxID=3149179 RepID=UPI00370D5C4D